MRQLAKSIGAAVLLCAVTAVPVAATPLWSFDFDAAGGDVSGAPGETVGWGYTIANDDPVNWLAVSALSSDVFQHGTPDPTVFDFPILAPGEIRTLGYSAGQGLFAFTWDVTAPPAFTNPGSFVLDAEFYDADPLAGGAFVEQAPTLSTTYSATVASVPEPASLTLLLLVTSTVLFRQRCRQTPRTRHK